MRFRIIPATALATAVSAAVLGCGGSDGDASDAQASDAPATIPQPTQAELQAAGLDDLPLAPESTRVDIEAPTFSNPTEVTNPLFPISDLRSAILSGRVDGKPFHTETTLLPETRMIEWSPGQWVEARVSQYMAFLGGRIQEVAIDYYAQADDGAVWYLGEEVTDYGRNGLAITNEGSWLAGREGPPEMIMPANPEVGQAHRTENIPAIAFEEVEIKETRQRVNGPTGLAEGAMIGRELHDDGTYSDKVFAPGYGEFLTRDGGDVEAMALAVPTDAASGDAPPQLAEISSAARTALAATGSGDWSGAAASASRAARAWRALPGHAKPPRLAREMDRALTDLRPAIAGRDEQSAGTAAIDVAQSALDLELRYKPPAQVDRERFELWARQVRVDAAAGELGDVQGDIATLELVRDRFAQTLDPAQLTELDVHLVALRDVVAVDRDLAAARETAKALLETLSASRG